MNTDLSLLLEFGHFDRYMNVIVQDRDGKILSNINKPQNNILKVDCKIKLPNKILITLDDKKHNTHTQLNYQNKFVKLSKLWLGNIELNQQTLLQMCEYKSVQMNHVKFTTHWDFNGTVTIDFFDKDFTSFLLHYHNQINL